MEAFYGAGPKSVAENKINAIVLIGTAFSIPIVPTLPWKSEAAVGSILV
jgi:hypothetical protein